MHGIPFAKLVDAYAARWLLAAGRLPACRYRTATSRHSREASSPSRMHRRSTAAKARLKSPVWTASSSAPSALSMAAHRGTANWKRMEGRVTGDCGYLHQGWSKSHVPSGALPFAQWPAAPLVPPLPAMSALQTMSSAMEITNTGILICGMLWQHRTGQRHGEQSVREGMSTLAALRKPPPALSGVPCQGKGQ